MSDSAASPKGVLGFALSREVFYKHSDSEPRLTSCENFGAILLVALVTAVVGFLALLMDFWSLRRRF